MSRIDEGMVESGQSWQFWRRLAASQAGLARNGRFWQEASKDCSFLSVLPISAKVLEKKRLSIALDSSFASFADSTHFGKNPYRIATMADHLVTKRSLKKVHFHINLWSRNVQEGVQVMVQDPSRSGGKNGPFSHSEVVQNVVQDVSRFWSRCHQEKVHNYIHQDADTNPCAEALPSPYRMDTWSVDTVEAI